MSISWKLSLPSSGTLTLHVIATIGTESMYAVAIPVTRLVAPGPLVAKQTPTFPVLLAYPSAAWDAPCSCEVSTCLISSLCLYNSSYTFKIAPPGYPKTVSTPCSFRHSMTICAPVSCMFTNPLSYFWFNGTCETPRLVVVIAGRGTGTTKTRFRSVSLATVLSFQPRSSCPGKPKPVDRGWKLRTGGSPRSSYVPAPHPPISSGLQEFRNHLAFYDYLEW